MKFIYIGILFLALAGPAHTADLGQYSNVLASMRVAQNGIEGNGTASSHQDASSLAEKRKLKSDRLLESIQNRDQAQLKALLSGYGTVSDSEIESLLDSIDTH